MCKIPFTEQQLQRMGELYVKSKWSTIRLGETYGISATAVARRLKERGIALRSGGNLGIPKDALSSARRMRKRGMIWRDISAKLGWHEHSLQHALKREGLNDKKRYIRGTHTIGGLAVKRCSACWVTKPLSNFHDDSSKRDGVQSRCAQCCKKEK